MPDLPLALVCADYPRLGPLLAGDVRAEGIALTILRGPRPEMLRRALADDSVAGGESSLALHLRRIAEGDRSFVALPVFVQRAFMARHLYGRRGEAGLLRERRHARLGAYSWSATGAVWARHFLRSLGAAPDSFSWTVGPTEAGDAFVAEAALPASVRVASEGRGLADLLIEGEIDLILSPARPARFDPGQGPIVRLFPDSRAADRNYFRQTGLFPPQHLILLRRPVWESAPWIAASLFSAFEKAERRFLGNLKENPFATPWFETELDETIALMGENFHPQGIAANRAALEIFAQEAHRSGVAGRLVSIEELFAEFLRA